MMVPSFLVFQLEFDVHVVVAVFWLSTFWLSLMYERMKMSSSSLSWIYLMYITAFFQIMSMPKRVQYEEKIMQTLLNHTMIDFQLGTLLSVVFVNAVLKNGVVEMTLCDEQEGAKLCESDTCKSDEYEGYRAQV